MKYLISLLSLAFLVTFFVGCEKNELSSPSTESGAGTGGSLARFTIAGDYLYTVDHQTLKTFNIASTAPVLKHTQDLGFGVETIFPFKNRLFIGTTTGVHIYDISSPEQPVEHSIFEHVESCDPVVANEQYAFATLRAGSRCRQGFGVSTLDVLNVSNVDEPIQISSQQVNEPYGLALNDSILYVCEGDSGLKLFNVAQPEFNVPVIDKLSGFHAWDAIISGNLLMVIGQSGLRQYDVSTPAEPVLLSTIDV